MKLVSIASGSSGNCIYVGNERTHLLVDAGISGKKIEEGLNKLDLAPYELDGILITHEHSDHIGGLGVLARRYGIPIFATEGSIKGICENTSVGEIDSSLFNVVEADSSFYLKDIKVNPMIISHDSYEPCAYRFFYGNKGIGVVTDLGTYNKYTVESLKNLDILFLEANHDVNMLQVGHYPYYLKQRILGNKGHLSNENCGRLLSELLHDNVKYIQLGHLSKDNNLPDLAYETVKLEVTMSANSYNGNDFPIYIAKRNELSESLCC